VEIRSGSAAEHLKKMGTHEDSDNYALIDEWVKAHDEKALSKLLTNHKGLVESVAKGYRGYGLDTEDLIAEGFVGVMLALKNFDMSKGFKFSTYAVWWIRSKIREFIFRTNSIFSLSKAGSTRTLFFSLRKLMHKYGYYGHLSSDQISHLANELNVKEKEIEEMKSFFSSHQLTKNEKTDDESSNDWQEWAVDTSGTPEEIAEGRQEYIRRASVLKGALACLNERDHEVFIGRRMHEPPKKLEELANKLGVSKERVRQIECAALLKLQKEARHLAVEHGLVH
jgi:RNA polymerase sigma-32 factor